MSDADTRHADNPFTWPVVAAVTVLALLCAGLVLLFVGGDDDSGTNAAPNVTLLPADDGDPLEAPLAAGATNTQDTTFGDLVAAADGRPMVLNFFASWCTPCLVELPDFATVSAEYPGIDWVGIAVNDDRDEAQAMADNAGVPYPWYLDNGGAVLASTRSTQMPTTVLLTADGEVAEVRAGLVSADELRELVEDHLLGDGA